MQPFFVTLYKFLSAAVLVLCFASKTFGNLSCVELFEPPKNTGLFRPIPSDYVGLSFSLRDMFVFDQFSQINKRLSAVKLRADVAGLPDSVRLLRAKEVLVAIRNLPHLENLSSEITYRLWMIFFAVDPQNAIREFKTQTMKNDSKPQLLQFVGEFLNIFDAGLARELAVELISDFVNARKTDSWFTKNDGSNGLKSLHPKKSISFLVKILMGFPAQLKSEVTSKKTIRFGTYNKFIESVTALFKDANVEHRPPTAEQVGTTINLLRQFLVDWSAKNPNEKSSIVVRGSFVNGLSVGRETDLDIIIVNPSLFQYFWNQQRSSLQDQIEKALRAIGLARPGLFIDPGDPDPKARASLTNQVARESGFLNSVSFEIFVDHVDILIHDHAKNSLGYPSFEIYRTE